MEGLQLLHSKRLKPVLLGNRAGPLQPAQEDFSRTGIEDCALS
jgi:hypothetical protein